MNYTMKNIFILGLIGVLISGCKDDPTSIGEQLIPEEDKISIFASNSNDNDINQNSRSFRETDEFSFASRSLLGMIDQSKYTTLSKFTMSIPDSVRSAVDSGKLAITKTWMELPVDYRLGERSAPFSFTVHEIISSWSAIGFNSDSLAQLQYRSENLASNIVEEGDTLVTLDFDNDIIMNWIEQIMAGDFINIPGIILIPEMSSQKVLGFRAVGTSAPESGIPTIYSVVEVPGELLDTLIATPFSDVYVPEGPDLVEKEERIYVQGANIYRSNLLFELSELPENITINNSVLRLYVDDTESFLGTAGTDSILVYSIQDSATMALDTLSRTRLRRTDNYFEGALTTITQVTLTREENHGVNLRLEQELSTANKIAFYGSDASDKALRPLLTIIYTKKN